MLSFSDFPCWTGFSAKKLGYLQVSTEHLPRAAFQVQQQNWDQIAKKNTTRLGGVLLSFVSEKELVENRGFTLN